MIPIIRILPLSFMCVIIVLSCASQASNETQNQTREQIAVIPGTYRAIVSDANIPEDVRGFHVTSEINFGFEADQTFIYQVSAMGRKIDDIGKWEIRGDSLYIFGLQKGPNTTFKITRVSEDKYEIKGPNHFILTRQEEMTPMRE